MKSCGHRESSVEIFPELAEAVERYIVDYGVTEFIVGNYGGFDRMAARAVISAKALHPGRALTPFQRFAKSRSRWIYPAFPEHRIVFCGDWGSASTSRTCPFSYQ